MSHECTAECRWSGCGEVEAKVEWAEHQAERMREEGINPKDL